MYHIRSFDRTPSFSTLLRSPFIREFNSRYTTMALQTTCPNFCFGTIETHKNFSKPQNYIQFAPSLKKEEEILKNDQFKKKLFQILLLNTSCEPLNCLPKKIYPSIIISCWNDCNKFPSFIC